MNKDKFLNLRLSEEQLRDLEQERLRLGASSLAEVIRLRAFGNIAPKPTLQPEDFRQIGMRVRSFSCTEEIFQKLKKKSYNSRSLSSIIREAVERYLESED